MKKILTVLLCVFVLFGCTKTEENGPTISIDITVQDEINDQELFKGTIETNKTTLADALEQTADVLKIEMEDSEYGKYITSIMDVAQTDTNFWVYESDNNKSCQEAGMCMGVSETTIEDGDNFTFRYTDTFE